MLYDYDGATSVSLAALGVLGNTTDDAMRSLYKTSDRHLLPDTEENRAKVQQDTNALFYTPLRSPHTFRGVGEVGSSASPPDEVAAEDVEGGLKDLHGPDIKWSRCATKWWKARRGKYVVTGEMNTSWVYPEDGKLQRFEWIDLGVEPDNTQANRHVIAISGGRFYCKNIRRWLPVKYLWLGKNGQPVKRRSGGKVIIDSLFTKIHSVYKVDV